VSAQGLALLRGRCQEMIHLAAVCWWVHGLGHVGVCLVTRVGGRSSRVIFPWCWLRPPQPPGWSGCGVVCTCATGVSWFSRRACRSPSVGFEGSAVATPSGFARNRSLTGQPGLSSVGQANCR